MNLASRIRKLSKMSWAEIRCRLGERVRTGSDRRTYRRNRASATASAKAAVGDSQFAEFGRVAGELFGGAVAMVPGHAVDEVERLQRRQPNEYRSLVETLQKRVDAIQHGQYELLGQTIDLSGLVDWRHDPVRGYDWPRRFYADVTVYDSQSPADVKYVWEVNRHQFLVELAQGWLVSGEEGLARRVRELLMDWIAQNPVYEGVNWTSGLEVAMRSVSWLWSLAALAGYDGWSGEDRVRITKSLVEHATYLERHLSFYTSPYNHLIGEATALYLLGGWLQGHPGAERWREKGRGALLEYGPRQFYADGFSVEQATSYHFFTLGFLCLAVLEGRRMQEPLAAVEDACSDAFRTAVRLRKPDGRWPTIGDLDSARCLPVAANEFWDFRSLCAWGAVLFDLDEMKQSVASGDDAEKAPLGELFWTLGSTGVGRWTQMRSTPRATRSAILPEAGYATAHSDDGPDADWFLLDAGPLGDGVHADRTPSTAHGHADVLNLLLHLDGKPVFVDPGLPFYAGEQSWIEYFRSAAAHNTIEVEGATWARPAGRLAWSHVQPRASLEARLTEELWVARAVLQLTEGARIERNVLGMSGIGVWIADFVECDTERRARWFWQLPLARQPRVEQIQAGFAEISLDIGVLAHWNDAPDGRVELTQATDGCPVGWRAPGYGKLTAGHRLMFVAGPSRRHYSVTAVGRELAPAIVQMHGRRSKCLPPGEGLHTELDESLDPSLGEDEVLWQIETPDGLIEVAVCEASAPHTNHCDSSAEATSPWKPVTGLGGLYVLRRERSVSRAL